MILFFVQYNLSRISGPLPVVLLKLLAGENKASLFITIIFYNILIFFFINST